MESLPQQVSLTYSIADQSFARTKSLGILNVSVHLLQMLAQRKEFSRLTVLANSSLTDFLAPPPSTTVEFHNYAGGGSLGRIAWDQIGLYTAARRTANEWLFLPKGFASFTRHCPVRLAVLVHDLMQHHYDLVYPGTVPRLEAAYFRAGFRASLRQAEIIFTPTEFTRQEILRIFDASDRDIPNVVCCGEGFDRPAIPLAAERRDILVLAGRFPHKLTRLAVDFLDRWHRKNRFAEKIHWIGSFPKNLSLPFHSNWQMHGRLPEQEFREMMARARAVLFFSDYEGFGRPPVEAVLAEACPVYSSIPATREVMGDCGCPFDNASYESFAAALDRALLVRPEQLRAWGEKLLVRHDWNKVVDRIITAFSTAPAIRRSQKSMAFAKSIRP